ncbi:unnamed protein product [Trichogramma brassicae]|uniref:Uncharacterized protein n=1 Tax=Trichogramma brassicae TaxID=86971 RepID=A0A6H5IFD2_9HYME|nr:unnamed protein product [Trichogramma brassicae]
MRTEHRDQASFCPFALREVSVLAELALGHLRYSLTDVPPQSNSPPGSVLETDHAGVQLANGRGRTPLLHAWLKNTVTAGIWIPGARVPPNRVTWGWDTPSQRVGADFAAGLPRDRKSPRNPTAQSPPTTDSHWKGQASSGPLGGGRGLFYPYRLCRPAPELRPQLTRRGQVTDPVLLRAVTPTALSPNPSTTPSDVGWQPLPPRVRSQCRGHGVLPPWGLPPVGVRDPVRGLFQVWGLVSPAPGGPARVRGTARPEGASTPLRRPHTLSSYLHGSCSSKTSTPSSYTRLPRSCMTCRAPWQFNCTIRKLPFTPSPALSISAAATASPGMPPTIPSV